MKHDSLSVHQRGNEVPPTFSVTLLDLIVLYVNVFNAKDRRDVGYENIEESYESFVKRLKETRVTIERADLEAALWAANMLSEQNKFWHPNKSKFNRFVYGVIHHKQLQYYFDTLYNRFIKRKPTLMRGKDRGLISSSAIEQQED